MRVPCARVVQPHAPRASTRYHAPGGEEEGHIKRDCPKYKAQDQSSDTVATAVMAVDESEVLLAASNDGKSDWIQRDAALMLVEEFSEFPRETRRCCGERRLEGYTDWRGMSRQEELLSDMGPVVLARRMNKGSNRCTKRSSEKGDQVDFEKLYNEGRGDAEAEASLFCSRFDQWRCSLQLCAQGRRDGATTTRKVTYFAAHPGGGWGWGAPQWGVQGTSGAGSEVVRKDNLKTSDYPPVGWRGRLLSPAHLDESKPTWMSPSPVAKPKPDWSSYGVSM
ncbi:hypothetical protein Acr_00g0076890 [Actinidia rufa]|uniref:Uncharacterized protein n=1 Tax=Actinidia rufa TaxID=165716 RepID=A0A7J0DT19_9ERIC|nr:hypothetical protein Acr_00g0076890 [Actinidia rufa]